MSALRLSTRSESTASTLHLNPKTRLPRGASAPFPIKLRIAGERTANMLAYQYILAAALITSPADKLDKPMPDQWHAFLAPALRTLALEWELLDKREMGYILAYPQDFCTDVKLLQNRFQDFGKAPMVFEAMRFPDRDSVTDLLAFNRAYRETLSTRLALDMVHAEELSAAMRETDQLYRIWDLVRDARGEYYYVSYRRQALQQLRDMVGAEAFYSGNLPPNVPLWRIPIVD